MASWPARKLWPPNPGVHAHHQHQIDIVEDRLDRGHRGRRVERDPGLGPELMDERDGAMEVRPGLGVDGDDVGAGLGEGGDEGIDRRNHQMDVEGERTVRPQRPDHLGTERKVGDEMPVHDVDVDAVGAGLGDRPHLLAELRVVRRQDRGGDANPARHVAVLSASPAPRKPARAGYSGLCSRAI